MMINIVVNNKHVKQINRVKVLDLIRMQEGISRKELSTITGLTPAAITGIVKDLIDLGFVSERGLGSSHGGRKPVSLALNSGVAHVIGVELSPGCISYGFTDMKSAPNNIKHVLCDTTCPDEVVELLIRLIKSLLQECEPKRFLGIGIAVSGVVDGCNGRVVRSVNLGQLWNKYELVKKLAGKIALPVFVDNNSNVAVMAEKIFDSSVAPSIAYINIGDGVSVGVLNNELLITGYKGFAGELGHMLVLPEGGLLCNCGNRGCLETICGLSAILRKLNMEMTFVQDDDPAKQYWLTNGINDVGDLVKLAKLDSEYVQRIFRYINEHIAIGISFVINMHNPEVVILGGKLVPLLKIFLADIVRRASNHTFPEVFDSTRITVSNMSIEASVSGACALALQEVLSLSNSSLFER